MKVESPLLRQVAAYAPYPRLHDTFPLMPAPSPTAAVAPSSSLASLLALASVAQNELLQRPRDASLPFLVLPEPQSPHSPASSTSSASSPSPCPSSPSLSPAPASPTLSAVQATGPSDFSLLLSLAASSCTATATTTTTTASFPVPPAARPQPAIHSTRASKSQSKAAAASSAAAAPSAAPIPATSDKKSGAFSHLPHKRAYKKAPLPASGKRCSSCNTNVTPEWRSGPQGPKTLCNACGLQYAKSQKLPRPPKSA